MTRFELANRLSRGLNALDEAEKHNVINMYIADINRRVERGENESDAIALLGDIDTLTDNILKSYGLSSAENIRPQEEMPQAVCDELPQVAAEETLTPRAKEKSGYTDKFYEYKNKFMQNKSAKKENKDNVENMNKGKGDAVPHVKGFIKSLWDMGTNFCFTITSLLVFVFICLPCMAITAAGFVTTSAVIVLYMVGGIGFGGICIAGIGCCIVGAAFCTWLGNSLVRGKRYE